jgi:uncharacterized protein YfaP (DUF2135 family)
VLGIAAYFLRGYYLPANEPVLHSGDVQATLRWEGKNDLDLHVVSPSGEEVYFAVPSSSDGGALDVDSNAGCVGNMSQRPVENIYWETNAAPRGEYLVSVVYYAFCELPADTSFSVILKIDGKTQTINGSVSSLGQEVLVHQFNR